MILWVLYRKVTAMSDIKVSKAQAMRRAVNQLRRVMNGYTDAGLHVEAMSIQAMMDARIVQLDTYICENFPIMEIRK